MIMKEVHDTNVKILNEMIDNLQKDNDLLRDEIEKADDEYMSLIKEIDDLNNQLDKKERYIEVKEKENRLMLAEIKGLNEIISDLSNDFQNEMNENAVIASCLDEERYKLSCADDLISNLGDEIEDYKEDIRDLNEIINNYEEILYKIKNSTK